MDLSARRQPPTVRLRRLAGELRRLRTESGRTRDEVSEQTGINSATLYRIETAKVRPQRRTLLALLDLYGVTDEVERSDLVALSKHANELGWLRAYEEEIPDHYGAYIAFESEARSVRNYESSFVPGLLQTEDYARAVIQAGLPLATPEEVQRRVEVRMQRQAVIRKKSPLRVWVILDEAALRRRVGGYAAMIQQLDALISATALPHVVVQVLPFDLGAHAGMPGPFVLMDFVDPADPDLVYIDSSAGDLFLERPADVMRYSTTFQHLQAAALNPPASLRQIQQYRDELEKGAQDD